MPTVRRKIQARVIHNRITPEVIEAWRTGASNILDYLLGIDGWQFSPFDIGEDGTAVRRPLFACPSEWDQGEERAIRLWRELSAICPPGREMRHGGPHWWERHGEPTGPET
jgi:hypothetical protein